MDLIGITDKDLIVFLVSSGLKIIDAQKENNTNHSVVFFEDNENLKKAKIEYVNRSKVINIADYIAAEKRVRALLYSLK